MPQSFCQFNGCRVPGSAAGHVFQTVMHFSIEECTCRNNNSFCMHRTARKCFHSGDFPIFQQKIHDCRIADRQIFLKFQYPFHTLMITIFVALSAGRPDSRSFCHVEHTELESCGIGHTSHRTAHGINFTDNVTFCDPADGRVAAHLGNMIQINGEKNGFRAHSGGGESCFTCGMTAAHNRYIITCRIQLKTSGQLFFLRGRTFIEDIIPVRIWQKIEVLPFSNAAPQSMNITETVCCNSIREK